MHLVGDQLVLSPPDLTAFEGCAHRSHLDRLVALGRQERPTPDRPVLQALGRPDGHLRRELARLESEGCHVVELAPVGSSPGELRAAEATTVATMRSGADVIVDATFFDGRWWSRPDLLVRVSAASDLGDWSYEVVGTRFARRAESAVVSQLCSDSEQVARVQGRWPDSLVVVVADGESHRHPLADTVDRHHSLRAELEALVDGPLTEPCYPEPVEHCSACPWSARCDARRRTDDHVRLVAGVRSGMAVELRRAGITTVTALASSSLGDPLGGIDGLTADRLRRQASLQVEARGGDGTVRYELLGLEPGRGLASLPAPSPGDLFFDMEGDPWVTDGGHEYLFGVAASDGTYQAFWGHDPAGEKAAFESLVDFVVGRAVTYPDLHVYHYAPYEPEALQKLATRHRTRVAEVERLVGGDVLVDLYRVVREGVRVSQEGYGLKRLEPLYRRPRQGHILDGAASVVAYEDWADTGDPVILESIRAYNADDCLSTLGLRDWLEARRAELVTPGRARP